jgi:hypothetical protein
VQYNGTGSSYQAGPAVSGPGTGQWVTAQLKLPGTQFREAENGGADLRLAASDSSQPLILRQVSLTAAP